MGLDNGFPDWANQILEANSEKMTRKLRELELMIDRSTGETRKSAEKAIRGASKTVNTQRDELVEARLFELGVDYSRKAGEPVNPWLKGENDPAGYMAQIALTKHYPELAQELISEVVELPYSVRKAYEENPFKHLSEVPQETLDQLARYRPADKLRWERRASNDIEDQSIANQYQAIEDQLEAAIAEAQHQNYELQTAAHHRATGSTYGAKISFSPDSVPVPAPIIQQINNKLTWLALALVTGQIKMSEFKVMMAKVRKDEKEKLQKERDAKPIFPKPLSQSGG